MAIDIEKLDKKWNEIITNITPEDIAKFFTDKRPKGWLSIEEHLPMMFGVDIAQGYSVFKVRDIEGKEFESMVSDHNVWYYLAKEAGITHWLNE
jgi:hypothetical protein